MQQRNSMNKKHGYIILVLMAIIVVSGFLTIMKITNLKHIISQRDSKISELEQNNSKLSKDIMDLNKSVKHNSRDKKEININESYEKIANQFVKVYPAYDVEKVKDKKEELLSITNETVANSIVPDDMINDSNKLKEGKKEGKSSSNLVYSTDPTFKSFYDSSRNYREYVTANKVNYFTILKYKTKSSSGDTENTTYLSFTVENKDGKLQVTEYQVHYLK